MSQAEDVEIIGDENETDEDLSIELHKLKVMPMLKNNHI